MKKLAAILVILSLGLVLTISNAFAFALVDQVTGLPYLGPVKFKFTHYTSGTLYAPGTILGPGAQDGTEDAWGIATVTSIVRDDFTNHNVWTPGAGEELTVMFYGLDDHYVNIPAGGGPGEIDSVGILSGAHLDAYLDTTPDFSPVGGPGARIDLSHYPTITDGTLFLSAAFVPGIHGDGTLLHEGVDTAVPFTGHGKGFLSVTGGTYASMFDTSTFIGGADMSVAFDTSVITDTGSPIPYGWTTSGEDPVRGNAAPEPTSMLLFGMGMLGLATRIRRKKAA